MTISANPETAQSIVNNSPDVTPDTPQVRPAATEISPGVQTHLDGFMRILDDLCHNWRAQAVIYRSCYPDGTQQDLNDTLAAVEIIEKRLGL